MNTLSEELSLADQYGQDIGLEPVSVVQKQQDEEYNQDVADFGQPVSASQPDLSQHISPSESRWYGNVAKNQNARQAASHVDNIPVVNDDEQERRKALAMNVVNGYVKNGESYMTRGDNRTVAFIDKGEKITSRLDDERTVSDSVDLMASKGVNSIKVSGSATYKRNAWVAVMKNHAGTMQITGYQPTKQDLQLFPENTMTADQREQVKQSSNSVVQSKLVAHGSAPYQNKEGNNESYYVTLSKDGKELTQWGVGLKEAVQKSGVQKDDNISIRKTESIQLENGNKRNSWVIDAPERHEMNKAQNLRNAALTMSGEIKDEATRKEALTMINDLIESHKGPLPEVRVLQNVQHQEPVQKRQEEQEELSI